MSQEPRFKTLLRDTKGLTTLEYTFLILAVLMSCVVAWKAFGRVVAATLGGAR